MSDDGTVAVYTSDTAIFPELVDACRDADLLIIESTWVDRIHADQGVHLWARESGRIAKEAGAKRLVLTHVWGTIDPAEAVAEASEAYGAPAEAAVEGAHYTL
jgi:ribonuclease BN (tRNA processing enzyme)